MPPPTTPETIRCFLLSAKALCHAWAESLQATRATGGSVVNAECLNPE
jgi:hypothetical protein